MTTTKNRLIRSFLGITLLALGCIHLASAHVIVTKNFTGIWDQPDQESQGFVIQIAAVPGGGRQGVVYWFNYDEFGNPFWLIGQGDIDDNQINLEFFLVTGPTFLAPSDPALRDLEIWGSAIITFSDCNNGQFVGEQVGQPDGSISFRITRLASVFATECNGGIADDFGPDQSELEIEFEFINTGLVPDASGEAEFEIESGRAEFEVEVENLPAGTYELVVGGMVVGTIEVVDDGSGETEGEIEFRSPTDDNHPLLTFDPRGQTIEIVQDGSIFLTTEFPDEPTQGFDFGSDEVEIEIELSNTGVHLEGEAEVSFESRPGRARFEVELEDVRVGTYELFLGGASRGLIEVTEDGDDTEGEIEFHSPADGDHPLLTFDPRGQLIEILDGQTVIFSGTLPDIGDDDDDCDDDC